MRLDAGNGCAELADFSVLVQPSINPELSDYFTGLTGITNAAVARNGIEFATALDNFAAFVGSDVVVSHGHDDAVIADECAFKEMANPLAGSDWRDVNPAIRKITGRRMPSSALPAHFGLAAPESAHDALADARSLARVLAYLQQ